MEEVIIDGKTVQFRVIRGEVLSTDRNYETHVTATGGGGYVDKHGGYVAPPKITSHAIEKHEFWIKDETGVERSFWLHNARVPLRPGQLISVVLAHRTEDESSRVVAVVNHSAENWNRVSHIKQTSAELRLIKQPLHVPVGIVGAILFAIGMGVTGSSTLIGLGFAGMAYCAYRTFMIFTKWPQIFKALDSAIRSKVAEEQASPPNMDRAATSA
ncbi:TPA: hypothetical protein ACLEB8_004846 [Pseudomonas aeruginosa]